MDDASEQALVVEFRGMLPSDLTPAQLEFCDDRCLRRFLRARDHDVDKALEMLLASLAWREEWRPEAILGSEMRKDLEMGKMYMHGFDKESRPVVIFRPGRDIDNGDSIQAKVRYYVFMLEHAIGKMQDGVEQMTWLVDLNGYSVGASDLKKLSLAQTLVTTLQDNYPERVGKMLLVNPPWYFRLLFGLLKPVISQKTLDKVVFAYSAKGDKTSYPELLQIVSEDNLESVFGGTLHTPANFDHFVVAN